MHDSDRSRCSVCVAGSAAEGGGRCTVWVVEWRDSEDALTHTRSMRIFGMHSCKVEVWLVREMQHMPDVGCGRGVLRPC